MFTFVILIICLLQINDDGTWRRIRKCDFASKFINLLIRMTSSHVPGDNEFECDTELGNKLNNGHLYLLVCW